MTNKNFGRMNAHAIGFIMKEMVRRAIEAIRAQRFAFEVTAKEGCDGQMDDIFTSADKAAQEIYVKMITEAFPGYGIVAEEDHLRVEPHPDIGMYFTVDPLDGTKAFKRRQSHGIGTMIALVDDGEVLAAYVGDVMTREIYGYRPGSEKVHRISEYGFGEVLKVDAELPLKQQNILLRERPERHTAIFAWMLQCRAGLFKDFEIATGSIGISTARLWKGEVGAVLLRPKVETPWDSAPVYGICRHLGFVMLEWDVEKENLVQVTGLTGNGLITPSEARQAEIARQRFIMDDGCHQHSSAGLWPEPSPTLSNQEKLIVHRSRIPELFMWLQRPMPEIT